MGKMVKFTIRNNASFAYYVKGAYRYFFNNENTEEEVKIVIRKNNVFIHINTYYCVICNDLIWLKRNNLLEADKKAIEWLDNYLK